MVPLPRQTGAARAPVRAGGAFAMGNKAKEGTPLPVESFNLEPGGLSPPKVVGMTMRLSEEVKSALLAAQKEGLSVQMKFGMNPQNHVSSRPTRHCLRISYKGVCKEN